jgi:oligoendopeptidase F
LGEEYCSILNNGINDRWIDVYPNKGKRTGGYSSGCYDTNPYILLNYQDKYDDMSTLAHELGHAENDMNGTSVTYNEDMANGKIGTPAQQAIEQEKRNRNELNSIYYENIVREKKEYPQRGYNYSAGD